MHADSRTRFPALSLFLLVALAAGRPGPAAAATVQPSAPAVFVYTARTAGTVLKSGTVQAAGIGWTCQAAACTVSGPWPVPGVGACQALSKQIGRIVEYGHPGAKLGAGDLSLCNQSLPPGAKGSKVTQPAPTTGGAAAEALTPAERSVPASLRKRPAASTGVQSTTQQAPPPAGFGASRLSAPSINALPVDPSASRPAGAGAGRLPGPGQAEEIREAAAGVGSSPTIEGFDPPCAAPNSYLKILGRHFGDRRGTRRVRLAANTPQRTPLDTLGTINWSDSQFEASIPRHRDMSPGQRYGIGIHDGRTWVSNVRWATICPDTFTVAGRIRLVNCAASTDEILLNLTEVVENPRPAQAQVVADSGDDFSLRYEGRLLPRRELGARLVPSLRDGVCPGGTWDPPQAEFSLGYAHPTGSRDFTYTVGEGEFRIALSLLAPVITARFRGTAIRINNYDPATGGHVDSDSYLRLPAELGALEWRFNIPDAHGSGRTYRISDIRLARITAAPAGDELRISFEFESEGTELLGTCANDATCFLGTPTIEADIRADVFVSFDRYLSSTSLEAPPGLSFGRVRVVATPRAYATGLCRLGDLDICDLFTSYQGIIERVVESSFQVALDSAVVRDQVAAALRPTLTSFNIDRVHSVAVRDGVLVVRGVRGR